MGLSSAASNYILFYFIKCFTSLSCIRNFIRNIKATDIKFKDEGIIVMLQKIMGHPREGQNWLL